MLPNFNTSEEKKAFAQKLYDLFQQDPRVTKILSKKGEDGLVPHWPEDAINAELRSNKGKTLPQYNGRSMPDKQMNELMTSALWVLRSSENIIFNPNISDEDIDREMGAIGEAMNKFQSPDGCEPLTTMSDYLDGYGKSKTGSPTMDFFMGISQTINNVVLTNHIMLREPDALSDKEEEALINSNQEELEREQNELAQMCAENDVAPDQLFNAFTGSISETMKARSEMSKKTIEAAEATKQAEGVDADKLLTDIKDLENKRDSLKRDFNKLGSEIGNLEMTKSMEVNLRKFENQRDDYTSKQKDLNANNKKSQELINEAAPKKEKLEKELAQHMADHPGLQELNDKYDDYVFESYDLDDSIALISQAFSRIDQNDTTINQYLQGKADGSTLSWKEKEAIDSYQKAKKEITEKLLAEDMNPEQLSEIFEQAEKSDKMSIGGMLLREDGPLQTRLREVRGHAKKIADSSPELRKAEELKKEIFQQEDIITEQEKNMKCRESEQEDLNIAKESLKEKERNFNKAQISKMEANNALPMGKTKEQLMEMSAQKMAQTMTKAAKQKQTERKQLRSEIDKLDNELRPKRELASKVKISKESAPELLNLQKKVKAAEEKTAKMEKVYQKGLKVTNMMTKREIGINKLKMDKAMNRENAVRESFVKTLKSLNQQVPTVKGEKNSPEYDKMQKGLSELLKNMQDSSFTAEKRAEAFGNLKDMAQKYLDEKNKQWRPFPSQKRLDRQRLAQDIVTFCKNSEKLSQETPSVSPDVLHEAARRDPKLNPIGVAEQKFNHQMKPKVEAAKVKLQKNQPANQVQKQQEQKIKTGTVSQLG